MSNRIPRHSQQMTNHHHEGFLAHLGETLHAWHERSVQRRELARWTERDLLRMLPPLDAAQRQFDTALLLGMSRVGKLGDYPADAFVDPRVTPLLERFRRDLGAVEQTIHQRNTARPPYVHMLPSRIPPGINI